MRNTILLASTIWFAGCAMTPGLIPGMSGKTKIEREFADADSHYTESISAPAGVDASKLSKFSLKLKDGQGMEYEVGVDASDTLDSTAQAAMLTQISADSLAALRSSLKTLEALTPGITQLLTPQPAPPIVSAPINIGGGSGGGPITDLLRGLIEDAIRESRP